MRASWTPSRTAHPRLRGEHVKMFFQPSTSWGSSPPTRGARRGGLLLLGPSGLIPAYAGSTGLQPGLACGARAHPRLRGEHWLDGLGLPRPPGSSPPTRGAQQWPLTQVLRTGLIPAYAGSTGDWGLVSPAAPAHPRLRGEHIQQVWVDPKGQGSSPPTRGAHPHHLAGARFRGLIPAYAGSTFLEPVLRL